MVGFIDYYLVLGITENASLGEIRSKYRQLAKTYHPDRNKGSDTTKSKMQSINEAYSILSNQNTKILYDAERLKYYSLQPQPFKNKPDSEGTNKKSQQSDYHYSDEELNEWILRAKKNADKNNPPADPSIGYLSIFGFFFAVVLAVIINLNHVGIELGLICVILLIITCVRCFTTLYDIFFKLVKYPIYLWLIMIIISLIPSWFIYFFINHDSGPVIVLSIFFTLPCLISAAISINEPKYRRY